MKPDLAKMRVGEVIEVLRVQNGEPTPEGFHALPAPAPSHHDRFSTHRAVRMLGPRHPSTAVGE